MLAGRIQPPLQEVAGDDERPGDSAIPGDLRIRADVDQCHAQAHGVQGLSGRQPVQATPRRCQKLIDGHPRHLARITPAAAAGGRVPGIWAGCSARAAGSAARWVRPGFTSAAAGAGHDVSGGRCGHAPARCPRPVQEYREHGGEQRGPGAIRAICQPGMPPTTTVWPGTGFVHRPGPVPCGSGRCLFQPDGTGGGGPEASAARRSDCGCHQGAG